MENETNERFKIYQEVEITAKNLVKNLEKTAIFA